METPTHVPGGLKKCPTSAESAPVPRATPEMQVQPPTNIAGTSLNSMELLIESPAAKGNFHTWGKMVCKFKSKKNEVRHGKIIDNKNEKFPGRVTTKPGIVFHLSQHFTTSIEFSENGPRKNGDPSRSIAPC